MGAVYLNTDLNLRARFDLEPLRMELAAAGLCEILSRQWHGVWESTHESSCHRHPSEAIEQMLQVVARLSPEGRQRWNACLSKRFNVGYACSEDPYPWTEARWNHTIWQFTTPLLVAMASADASFVVTIYPRQEPEMDAPA